MVPAKILVVDDVPGQRLAIEAALAELEERVIAVASGAEALRFLLDEDVAVILLDVNMPEMDGFETASLIRQRPRSRHTPIIFLTADTNEMQAARAYSLGAVDYIVNPFLPGVLRAKVRVFVELSKTHERMKREAEQRVALSRAQAARAAAEEESRRLRFLAEASGVVTRSLEPTTLVADLLLLFVPLMADVAAMVLLDAAGRPGDIGWLDADAAGRVSHDPLPPARAELADALTRVIAGGRAVALTTADGLGTRGTVIPLVARGRTLGALGACGDHSGRLYSPADLDLIADVAARTAIALDNGRLYHEIQERDRQKDEFLAMLSHELRNPLGAICTAARLLEAVGSHDERAVRARDVVNRQAGHLARIVDDLLDVARVTAGRIALTPSPLDLGEVVQRSMDALRVAGRLDHHQVSTTLEPVTVNADVARMEQIVTNLVVNATKYTDRAGRIDVTVAVERDSAVLRVSDTGIGMTAEMIAGLFEPFRQGRQSLDRAQGGLGIGLALARRLVELQGGTIDASSPGPGRGSTFTVRLPRVRAEQRPEAVPMDPEPATPRMRILLVEDNTDVRDMLRTLLELGGHEVHEAGTGLDGLHMATRLGPDLALIDLGLPGLDGLEVAARIRSTPEGKRLVLVALTGYGQAKDRQRTLEAGFDFHLVKPVDPERLNDVIAVAIRRTATGTLADRRRAS